MRERSNGCARERKQKGRVHWWRGNCWKADGGRERACLLVQDGSQERIVDLNSAIVTNET